MAHRPWLSLTLALALTLAAGPMPAAYAAAQAPAVATQAPALHVVQTTAGPIHELTLANGLKVILKENHAAPVVTWAVGYKVGSRNEPAGATGSAHLLEHMLFKGTKTLGKGQIARLLERNGADYNAFTDHDMTCYYETYASDRLEMGLMVEAARMRDALILDSERQSEMTVVRNELERGESDPGGQLWHAVGAAAFHSHPYHHPIIGWRADVEGVSTAQLKKFYDAYYQPNNAIAVLVGDFDPTEAAKLIQRHFGGFPKGPTPPEVHTQEEVQLGERRVTLRRKGETNMLQMAFHTPATSHPDMAALMVLDTVLSSGVTSRLYQAIVERELANSAWSSAGSYRDPSLFRLGATLKPGGKHAEVEAALWREVEKIQSEPVSADELAKAKAQAEAGMIYQNEGTRGMAFMLAYHESMGSWRRGFSLMDDLKKVTASDLQRVAKTYLTPDNRTVGWYVATADGPVPPQPKNAGDGKAAANKGSAQHPALYPFEKAQFKARRLTTPTRQVLKNGLTVLVLPNDVSQTVSVSGFVRAGGLQDPADKEGLASAVASMLDNGTTKRTKLQLAADLERVSASIGFSGGTTSTSVSAGMLAKDLDLGLTALAETLREPAFPETELDKLKRRWVDSIKQGEDDPGTHASRAFAQAVFPKGHAFYQNDAATDIAMIERLTVADLRAFHARHYGPNATTLVVVGKVKPAEVVAKLETLFAGWKPVAVSAMSIPDVAAGAPKRVVVPMMDKTNVEIVFGHAGALKRKDPGYYASALANDIIGGSTLTSRLGVKLRDEMGLTYGVYSSFNAGTGAGPWKAGVTANPANADVAIKALRQELDQFLTKGITAQELAYAKSSFIGSQAQGLATNGGMASSLSNIEFYGLGLDYWAQYPGLIQGVTLEQANAAAKRLIDPAKAHTVIVGPYQDKK
jgi:zinc protease